MKTKTPKIRTKIGKTGKTPKRKKDLVPAKLRTKKIEIGKVTL